MPVYILYLLKLSVSLTIVWLFYRLFLQRLTFYTWNRWYLLVYSLLCFVIPLINITPWVEKQPFGEGALINYIPVLLAGGIAVASSQSVKVEDGSFLASGWNILLLVLVAGAGVLLIRLMSRLLSFRKILRGARLVDSTEYEAIKLYHVEEDIVPFSFGNAIYINQRLHTEKEWEEIVLHEYVHVRQRHTIDILVAEWLCILNWYNPFAWLIRFAIRQNLEFIADNKVLENGSDRKAYQYHLLKVVGNQPYRIANNFNFSSLKKRIIMMNRIKSARVQLIKFLFLLPLMAILLLAFRDQYNNRIQADSIKIGIDDKQDRSSTPLLPVGEHAVSLSPIESVVVKKNLSDRQKLRIQDTLSPGKKSLGGDTLTLPKNMLYVLNGSPVPAGWSPSSIDQSVIKSISILKGQMATSLFGTRGANGVIAITTGSDETDKIGFTYDTLSDASSDPQLTQRIVVGHLYKGPNNSSILYYVDGIEMDSAQFSKVPQDQIESIRVVKGPSAIEKYGQKAKNGVIVVTLKKPAGAASGKASGMAVRFDSTSHKPSPLFVLNGWEIDSAQVVKIPASLIDSVMILTGNDATSRYGEKGRNGVVQIRLKNPPLRVVLHSELP